MADENFLAVARDLFQKKETALAIAKVECALKTKPDDIDALLLLAELLCDLKLWGRAEVVFRRLLRQAPNEWMHWSNLLISLCQQRRPHEEIMPIVRMAVALTRQAEPATQSRWLKTLCSTLETNQRGIALQWAAEQWRQMLPDDQDAVARLAVALHQQKDYQGALAAWKSLGKAIDGHKDWLAFMALAYQEAGGLLDEDLLMQAEACWDKVLGIGKQEMGDLHNYALTLALLGRRKASERVAKKAVEMFPNAPSIKYQYAEKLLRKGDYRQGFLYYEERIASDTPDSPQYIQTMGMSDHGIPMWDGSPLNGQRVFIPSEQGHGDFIMMVRFFPSILKAGAGEVRYFSPPGLTNYCQALPCNSDRIMYSPVALHHEVDVYLPLMSLPNRLGVSHEADIPPPMPPRLDPAICTRWQERFRQWCPPTADGMPPLVGITWRGSDLHPGTRLRNIDFDLFMRLGIQPLLASGVKVISLQKDASEAQREQLAQIGVITAAIDTSEDWLDSTHMLTCLDALLSVDTAVVHLAGSLGVPVVMLNRHPAVTDWRWLNGRSDSPWYPGLHIVAQERVGRWDDVLERALKVPVLNKLMQGHKKPSSDPKRRKE